MSPRHVSTSISCKRLRHKLNLCSMAGAQALTPGWGCGRYQQAQTLQSLPCTCAPDYQEGQAHLNHEHRGGHHPPKQTKGRLGQKDSRVVRLQRALMSGRARAEDSSAAVMASRRSCLLAITSTGTPSRWSCPSSPPSSLRAVPTRPRSVLSTTCPSMAGPSGRSAAPSFGQDVPHI